MSTDFKAMATDLPTDLPMEDIDYVVAVLTKKEPLQALRGVKAAYGIVGFLLGKFLNQASAESLAKAKTLSKAKLAEQLTALKGGSGEVTGKAFPTWLIPILLDLASKWAQGSK